MNLLLSLSTAGLFVWLCHCQWRCWCEVWGVRCEVWGMRGEVGGAVWWLVSVGYLVRLRLASVWRLMIAAWKSRNMQMLTQTTLVTSLLLCTIRWRQCWMLTYTDCTLCCHPTSPLSWLLPDFVNISVPNPPLCQSKLDLYGALVLFYSLSSDLVPAKHGAYWRRKIWGIWCHWGELNKIRSRLELGSLTCKGFARDLYRSS